MASPCAGIVPERGSGAGVVGQTQDCDGEIPQGGHDSWGAGGADLGAIFVEVHVTDPVQAVLKGPAAADDDRQFRGWPEPRSAR